jgi:hypothetical protein
VPNRAGGGDFFAMVSEDYDGVDSPWNLSNAVQVNEPKNLIRGIHLTPPATTGCGFAFDSLTG